MILADKIMELRKRNGLSQEELGDRIHVSRQAVSKWETAQAVPDLNRIMALAELFQVPTDFLLKDEYGLDELSTQAASIAEPLNTVEICEVQDYLASVKQAAQKTVIALFLLFLSPFPGLFLMVKNERIAVIGAVVQILFFIAAAAVLFPALQKTRQYRWLKDSRSELGYGVRSIVQKQKEQYAHTHTLSILLGAAGILACTVPMMVASLVTPENDMIIVVCGLLMILLFTAGLSSIIASSMIQRSFSKVLKVR